MTRDIIKVLGWNLNFASYDNAMPATFIDKYIKGFDVVVLTEVRANKDLISMIEQLELDYIVSDDQGKFSNQIIIAAKREYKLKKIAGSIIDNEEKLEPDFLHGIVEVGHKRVNVLGVRIKTSDYTDRLIQAKQMTLYLSNLEGSVIGTGDFNCGQIRGEDEAGYSDVQILYKYRNRSKELSDLRYYNFHLIKDLVFGGNFVLKETMGEDNSWGLVEKDGKIIYGLGRRVKNDLMFYSNDIAAETRYSWEHVRQHEQNYIDMLIKNCNRRGNKIEPGYPDHARLVAELAV